MLTNIYALKNRAIKSRLVNDSFWALFGNVVGKGLALAAGIIVARFLGKEIYGEYGIIRNTLMSIAIFSTFGLGYTATKYVAEYKNSNPEYLRAILYYARNVTLLVSGFMAVVLFFSSTYIAERLLDAHHLSAPLRLVAVWIVFNAVTTTQIGVLAGFGNFKGIAKINTIVGISTFIVSLFLTYHWNLFGALAALLITQILNWYLNFRLIENHLPKQLYIKEEEKPLLREMLKFSLPIALQEAIYSGTAWLTSLLLIKFSTYGELGLYSAAMQWNTIILFIPGILRNVILSHLSLASKDSQRHDRVMRLTLLFNFIMTFIPSIGILIFSDSIVNLYGENFQGLKGVVSIAVFTTIFSSLSNVFTQAYISKGKTWLMFSIRAFRDCGLVVISLMLLTKTSGSLGAMSIVYASLIINSFFLVAMWLIYKTKLQRYEICAP